MPKSCKEATLQLLLCLRETDCMKEGGSVKECLQKERAKNSNVCQMQVNAFYLCKRSQLDMRTRIRGTRVY